MPHGRSKPKRRSTKPRRAATADRHDLYQRAVQCTEAEIDFVDATFKSLRGRTAVNLREDFCGPAATCCEWVRRRAANQAVGLDIDPAPLAWGRKHNLGTLTPAQRRRVRLEQASVTDAHPEMAGTFDAVLAMNFSYWVIKDRAAMISYFRRVRDVLGDDGVFFLDACGGSDAYRICQERRPIREGKGGRFTYVWDHAAYNPITGDITCNIHFAFPDGSRIRRAFTYDWRLWTLPEIREMLSEAGFARSTIYWEGDDRKGSGNGVFTPSETGEACESFVCYIVAEK